MFCYIITRAYQNIRVYWRMCRHGHVPDKQDVEDIVGIEWVKSIANLVHCVLEAVPQLYLQLFIIYSVNPDDGFGGSKSVNSFIV